MIHERIRHNLEEIQARITRAAASAGRPVEDVRLVAVTKKSTPEWIGPCWIAAFLISAKTTRRNSGRKAKFWPIAPWRFAGT